MIRHCVGKIYFSLFSSAIDSGIFLSDITLKIIFFSDFSDSYGFPKDFLQESSESCRNLYNYSTIVFSRTSFKILGKNIF